MEKLLEAGEKIQVSGVLPVPGSWRGPFPLLTLAVCVCVCVGGSFCLVIRRGGLDRSVLIAPALISRRQPEF